MIVVNDDPSQLRLCAAILEKAGMQVRSCLSAEEALRHLQPDAPVDAIITDLHMPGIDGWRLCELLRSAEYAAFNETPVLVVSATYAGSDAEQLSIEIGANGFLAAPYAPSALQEHVRALLDGRKPSRVASVLLVAEDGEAMRQNVAAFRTRGFHVERASTCDDVWRLYRERAPEIVVIDDGFPHATTDSLLDEMTRLGTRGVVVVLSEEANAERVLQATSRGAEALVSIRTDPLRLVETCDRLRRQRNLLLAQEMLDQRNRALHDSEQRWRSLLEGVPEAVFVYNDDGLILHVNRIAAERLGLAPPDLIGRSILDFEPHRSARPRIVAVGAADATVTYETVYASPKGARMDVEVSERRIRFDGKPAILAVARDVTPGKELGRQRARFLAMLTHEIRDPLSVILGFAAMLPELGEINAAQHDVVVRMKANVQAVLTLVANYLTAADAEVNRLDLLRRPMALNDAVRRVCEQIEGEASSKRIRVEQRLDPTLPSADLDVIAVEQALTNILRNAIRFAREDAVVEIETLAEAEHLVVAVSDFGCGIGPDELSALFRPPHESQPHHPHEGARLGLYVTKSLIEAHGGTVDVTGATEKGTRLTMRFPMAGTKGVS